MASPLFSVRAGSGPATGPNLTAMQGYSGDTSISNTIADALAASGLVNGVVTFPSGAVAHNTIPYIFRVQFVSVSDNFSIIIRHADGNIWGEIATNIDGAGATFYGSEGGYQLELAVDSLEWSLTNLAQGFIDQLSNMGISGASIVDGTTDVVYGADENALNPPSPTITGSIGVTQTQMAAAVRRPSVQTLIDRGWSVGNAT